MPLDSKVRLQSLEAPLIYSKSINCSKQFVLVKLDAEFVIISNRFNPQLLVTI